MNEQEVNEKFGDIIQPKIINQVIKQKRPPAKFPELRYLWGVALLGSFVLSVITSVITTLIHGN
jgi:hypothetical protein